MKEIHEKPGAAGDGALHPDGSVHGRAPYLFSRRLSMIDWLRQKRNVRRIGRWLGWAAFVLLLLTFLTGYGISEFRLVGSLTFGLLNKVAAHRLHLSIEIPLLVLVLAHVGVAVGVRLSRR